MSTLSFYLLAGLALIAVLFLIMIAAQLSRIEKSIAELLTTVEARVREMYQNPK